MKLKDYSSKDWFARSDAPTNIGQEYEEKAVKDHKYFVRVKSRHFLRVIKKLHTCSKDFNCVDLGCGTAETTEHFQDEFKYTIGCDYSFGMLKFAGQKKTYDHQNSHDQNSQRENFTAAFAEMALQFNLARYEVDFCGLRESK